MSTKANVMTYVVRYMYDPIWKTQSFKQNVVSSCSLFYVGNRNFINLEFF